MLASTQGNARTRERTTDFEWLGRTAYHQHLNSSGVWVNQSSMYRDPVSFAFTESVIDEVNPDFNKNCWHRKYGTKVIGDVADADVYYPPGTVGDADSYGLGSKWTNFPPHRDYLTTDHFTDHVLPYCWEGDLQDFTVNLTDSEIAEAFVSTLPSPSSITGNFSALNFIAELRELKDLTRAFKESNLLKKLASGHLTWEFGIRPLLADLSTIFGRLLSMKEFVDDWNKAAKAGDVYTYHCLIKDDEGTNTGKYYFEAPNSWRDSSDYSYTYKNEYRLHTYIEPRHIDWDLNKWVYLARGMGFHRPVTTLWNAIPFTFIIDWIVNVNDVLSSIEGDTELLSCRIRDVSVSKKSSVKCQYRNVRLHSWNPSLSKWIVVQQLHDEDHTMHDYVRWRIHPPIECINSIPLLLKEWKVNVPSLKQWILAADLVIANS